MKVAVVVFPGSNCDHDTAYVCSKLLHASVNLVWHRDTELGNPDVVVVPGGFSYGDYLRTGALAKVSPVMESVARFAKSGGPVLGICNGFQILCEAQLLPGALLQNERMKFLSTFVNLRIENHKTPFTKAFSKNEVVQWPIAHFEGNYFANSETIKRLEGEGRIVVRYCGADGSVDPDLEHSNPNGAARAIAGICNEQGNVVGMMPHPERASETLVGNIGQASGLGVFESCLA